MNLDWREVTASDVPLESKFLLAKAMEAALLSALSLPLAKRRRWLQCVLAFKVILCHPNLTYTAGASHQHPPVSATQLIWISLSHNLVPGQFQILTFTETHLLSLTDLKPVTVQPSSSNQYATVIEEQVQGFLYGYVCPCLRRFVTQMLQAYKHLIGSTDVEWLVEKLSYCVIDADIKMVLEPLCLGRKVNNLTSVPASDLAQLLWIKSPVEHPQKWSKLICRTTSPLFVTS